MTLSIADVFNRLAVRANAVLCSTSMTSDSGYDSIEEQRAALALVHYGRHGAGPYPGGALSGGAIVRVLDREQPVVYGWLNPHFDDPVAVKISPDGAYWRFADHPEENAFAWLPIDSKTAPSVVAGMCQLLHDNFDALYPQLSEPPQGTATRIRPADLHPN